MKSQHSPKSSRAGFPKSSVKRNLVVIDHSVRGAFLTLAVTVLSLSFLAGAVAIFNANPSDYAKAQEGPTDPGVGQVVLPGSNNNNNGGGSSIQYNAQITSITRSATELTVNFQTVEFNNQQNSVHTNFYFNTEANSVTNKSFYAASPFKVNVSSIPSGATQMCVIVALANNAVVSNTGNCVAIPAATTTTNPGSNGSPSTDSPETPTVTGEVIGVGGDGNENVTTTTTDQNSGNQNNNGGTPVNNTQQQALNAAQQNGTTARSGGPAVVTGLILLAVVGYYVYYRTKGDRKAILKTAEKKINLKK